MIDSDVRIFLNRYINACCPVFEDIKEVRFAIIFHNGSQAATNVQRIPGTFRTFRTFLSLVPRVAEAILDLKMVRIEPFDVEQVCI